MRVIYEYVNRHADVFLRVFDKGVEPMEAPRVYNYNLIYGRSDDELSSCFSSLGYANPSVCEAHVPAGCKIKCWARANSNHIYMYEIEMASQPEFINERVLPKVREYLRPQRAPHLAFDFFLDVDMHFIKLYDKVHEIQTGNWLFDAKMASGKSGEQLQQKFYLPFVPRFICDVMVLANQRIEAWAMPGEKDVSSFQFNGLRRSGEERLLE